MVDAVTAIKQHYATLSAEGKQNLLKQFGVSDINGLNLIRPEIAEKYCKTHHINLGDVSVWKDKKYAEAKANWENEYANYQGLKTLQSQQKTRQAKAYQKYMTLFTKQQNGEGGVVSTEVASAMKTYSLLTKTVSDTDSAMNISLAMQWLYNDSQRRFS